MLAFMGSSGLEVNHLDGDKGNNSLSNLEYCSRSQNIRHSHDKGLRTGVNKGKYGAENHLSHKCRSIISGVTYGSLREMGRNIGCSCRKIRDNKVGFDNLITLISL